MAEQEALARAKYGNLATRGRAGSIGKEKGIKRFDSADWAMSQGSSAAPQKSLLQRTLQGLWHHLVGSPLLQYLSLPQPRPFPRRKR